MSRERERRGAKGNIFRGTRNECEMREPSAEVRGETAGPSAKGMPRLRVRQGERKECGGEDVRQ